MATRKIKVLSVKQPWATLLVIGAKEFETRTINTNYRGELFIHATKRVDFDALELCYQSNHFKRFIPDPTVLINGAIIGKVEIVSSQPVEKVFPTITPQERAFGNYIDGRVAWQCANAVQFEEPILGIGGLLGIWELEVEEEDLLILK